MADFPTSLEPLAGGHSGETFVAEVAGERTVVRIYAGRSAVRGPHAAEIDMALLSWARTLLPVPRPLEARRAGADGVPALLVTEFLPGERLDVLLPRLTATELDRLGRHLGVLLGRLGHVVLPRTGAFADPDLTIRSFPAGADDLAQWIEQHLREGPLTQWEPAAIEGLREVATRAQTLLDGVPGHCLVHSDFNPKNLLVDPETLEVTGLLDWEFSHAGGRFTDLGNLLRFESEPAFVAAVLTSYADFMPPFEGKPDSTDDLAQLARAADLFALVELAARRDDNPVAARAHGLLLATARAG